MLITQKNDTPDDKYFDFIKKCADGGITSLQLREKSLDHSSLLALGSKLMSILAPYHIPLVVNDFPTLAKELGTEYIHVGQKDDSITKTRSILPNAKIGISIESLEQLHSANDIEGLAYVTASAVFPSTNKDNLLKIWGLDGVQTLSQVSTHPLTAIGGINLENTADIINHGARGIALIGAIHDSTDPYTTCKKFRDIIDHNI